MSRYERKLKEKKCDRCLDTYLSTGVSKYCHTCRDIIQVEKSNRYGKLRRERRNV
jgi:hypothetical protein